MKTINEIIIEIKTLTEESNNIGVSEKERNKARNKIHTMNLAKNYMEFNPSIDSIKRQKQEVERYLKIHDDRYKEWLNAGKNSELLEPKKAYKQQSEIDWSEIAKWKSELKFLNYILS